MGEVCNRRAKSTLWLVRNVSSEGIRSTAEGGRLSSAAEPPQRQGQPGSRRSEVMPFRWGRSLVGWASGVA